MFAIYDKNGRIFRDTLERLRAVRAISSIPNASLRMEDGERSQEGNTQQSASQVTAVNPYSDTASQAYRKVINVKERELIIHAYQLMSHPVTTISATLDILSARQLFIKHHYQQLPVLNEQQHIVGILQECDLLRFMLNEHQKARDVRGKTVSDAMSAAVITADPISDVRRLAEAMLSFHLSALPIVDDLDSLIGLITRSDILRAATNDPPLSLWT